MTKVVVTDFTFPDLSVERTILEPLGFEVMGAQAKAPEALIPLVHDADAVITQFAAVNAEVIQAMSRAKVIVRYGIGVDNVDLQAARARNIPVCNVPDYCIDEVADHTLAFILASTRQVVPNALHNREGRWGLATPLSDMKTLKDLTVGVVGFGRIGREVVDRLRAFKTHVMVYDPIVPPNDVSKHGAVSVSLDELLQHCDIVSLHCPSTSDTKKLLRRETIDKMKHGAMVINLARGDLVDTAALVDALQSGRLASAALDVCDPEPIPLDSPLRTLPNVITASHIASASVKAVAKLRQSAAQHVVQALKGLPLSCVVNGVV